MVDEERLDGAGGEAVAARVREELARRRMSRQALADMARISLSTLEKALAGRRAFTLATLVRVEDALGISLRERPPASGTSDSAPEALGGYARGAVRWLEGRYVALRPLFADEAAIHAYLMTIEWDGASSRLVFAEGERIDSFAQRGAVSLPHLSGQIYLVTDEAGQYRLAILSRPTISGSLYGVLTTLLVGQGSQLVPASCPFALVRLRDGEAGVFGRIERGHPAYDGYRAELDAVLARDFARFPGAGRG